MSNMICPSARSGGGDMRGLPRRDRSVYDEICGSEPRDVAVDDYNVHGMYMSRFFSWGTTVTTCPIMSGNFSIHTPTPHSQLKVLL
ncbi:hypothetical protein J6590_004225 [Homalodisca vitripennis]|nr:hypothetical protein J6590_004225 [Homalodisca vitripennis]